ncbi:hypothetical protein B0H13DRAFT_2018104 [Mycena leptocephala]|nr:hypothetical protein B0H13DRAFT_2018104 [Mycena leptocephala]
MVSQHGQWIPLMVLTFLTECVERPFQASTRLRVFLGKWTTRRWNRQFRCVHRPSFMMPPVHPGCPLHFATVQRLAIGGYGAVFGTSRTA